MVSVVPATSPGNANYEVQDSVAYSLQCQDSPAEYNDKMLEQRLILHHLVSEGEQGFTAWEQGWSETTAPPSRGDPGGGGPGVWSSYVGAEVVSFLSTDADAGADVKTARPYRPGYSAQLWQWTPTVVTQSAGVDCVGLVQRAASYPGNPYTLPDIGRYAWGDANPSAGRVEIVTQEDNPSGYHLTRITEYNPSVAQPSDLDKVVPGDILYYPGYHVAIVAEVKHVAGRLVTMEDILLLEATWGYYGVRIGVTNRVLAKRILQDLDDAGRPWVVGRLIRSGR